MFELKTPNDYRLFNFDFIDVNFDDFYRCQVVFKMFLEIDVIDKFNLSAEVTQPGQASWYRPRRNFRDELTPTFWSGGTDPHFISTHRAWSPNFSDQNYATASVSRINAFRRWLRP